MKFNVYLKRSVFIVLLTAASVCCYAQKKPNIVLIMADDLGYETLGCNGNDDKMTPQLDALAETGMRFEHCYSTPLCTPSRVQLMTGKYNQRNYIGFGLLDPKETTFGTLMKQQGYKTCIAGKWQLFGNDMQRELAGGKIGTLPQNTGFDNYCLWQVDSLGSRYANPTVYENGRSTLRKGEYGPDIYTSYIEKFMEKNVNEPFFVYYPMCLTHDPFTPTPFSKPETANAQGKQQVYFKDMVRYMDHEVGRLIKKVDELGIRENTVFIFIGDNGTSKKITSNFKGGKRQGNKGSTTERGTRVPLIVNWSGISGKGSTNNNLVDFTDFLPTLLDITGANKSNLSTLEGTSFYPQLKNIKSPVREWVFCHYDPRWGNYTAKTFVHDKELKVYRTGEVYDLAKDPDETKPLDTKKLNASQQQKLALFKEVINKKMNN